VNTNDLLSLPRRQPRDHYAVRLGRRVDLDHLEAFLERYGAAGVDG